MVLNFLRLNPIYPPHPMLNIDDAIPSTHGNQDFNVFLPMDDIDDNVSSSTTSAGETRGGIDTIAPETTAADGLSATSMASARHATSPPYSPSNGGAVRGVAGVDGGLMGLLTERPAVVEEVLHESVVTGFNCLGSSADYGVVGCVVASISREPFLDTEVSPKVRCPRGPLENVLQWTGCCGVVLSLFRSIFFFFRLLKTSRMRKERCFCCCCCSLEVM